MNFHSVLFEKPVDASSRAIQSDAPSFFIDLNLDQMINALTADKHEYNLKPLYYESLHEIESIHYRQEIMKDLDDLKLSNYIKIFSKEMQHVRNYLHHATTLYYHYQKVRLFLDAVNAYCEAVISLGYHLSLVALNSRGLTNFREYVSNYIKSDPFILLYAETKKIISNLSLVHYSIIINDGAITVGHDENTVNYSDEVERIFSKFKQGATKDYTNAFTDKLKMNHVEAQILDRVVKLYPEVFKSLDAFFEKSSDFLDEKIVSFDREIQFYIAYLDYIAKVKKTGLSFCYPEIADKKGNIYSYDGFDLPLAIKLINDESSVVCNNFYLSGDERIIIVTGPNQGGKTTFARMFGQLHYLASLGLPVPGKKAKLFCFDRIFSHFEKEESIETLRGKLEDDLVRVNTILNQASADSIVLMNEIYTSTTVQDAIYLSKRTIEIISQLDLLCVWVTFIDELASFNGKTVSMVSTVLPEDATVRTYKIVRHAADGFAYAISLAKKYRLTYEDLMRRIKS